MKRRVLFLLATFFVVTALFSIQKPAFMLYNWAEASAVGFVEWLQVVMHGLSLDFTVAGYLTMLPVVMTVVSVWWRGSWWKTVFKVYFLIVAVVMALIFAVDMALYPFWGFKIDSSVLFYMATPKDAMASVSLWLFVRQMLIGIAYGTIAYFALLKLVIPLFDSAKPRLPLLSTLGLILFGGVLILPIRGGLSASTANEGRVYFSQNMFLNHAAVNPCFSLLSSAMQDYGYAEKYTFFDEPTRAALVEEMITDGSCADSAATVKVLSTERPNVILILLESFSANAIEVLGGEADVTPNINALSRDGVLFKRAYASSFRTDRGLVATLNGYPGQPTTSIMKYPAKTQNLPSIASELLKKGYNTAMYYGGDVDFTNMRSYFYASGYQTVEGQDKMSFNEEMSRWGYNDSLMFGHLYREVRQMPEPFFATMLTLSSHEPFDVPYSRLADPYLNSMAFTDHCIGRFVDSLKHASLWDNTLIVMVSDHGYRYPESIGNNSVERQHIPMLWIGGAVEHGLEVDFVASQTDLAATLLAQFGIETEEFRFSKNLFDPRSTKRAIYSFNNGVGVVDSTGFSIWDFTTGSPMESSGDAGDKARADCGKAFIQTLMQDFDRR